MRNNGVVIFDQPGSAAAVRAQATIGYARELTPALAINVDYIHTANRDMFLARNLNPMVRANTTPHRRDHARRRVWRAGRAVQQQVWVMENTGDTDYNALNLSLEKRYSNNWSGRVSYSLSKSRGTAENQADTNTYPDPDRPQPR